MFTDRMNLQNNNDTANVVFLDANDRSYTIHMGNMQDNIMFADGLHQGIEIAFDMAR